MYDPTTSLICSAEIAETQIAYHREKQTPSASSVDGQEIATIVAADIISLNPDPNKFPTFTASIGKEDFKTFTVTITTTDIDQSLSAQFPITLMANTTTNVDFGLEGAKAYLHSFNMYNFWIKPYNDQDTIVLRFTFDGASTAENSAMYFDYTLTTIDGNYVSAEKGITAKQTGGAGQNCAQTHCGITFEIENFTDEYIRQAKLWKKPKGATDWTLDPDFYIW